MSNDDEQTARLRRALSIARDALKYIEPVYDRALEALDAMREVERRLPCGRCDDDRGGYHSCDLAPERDR